MTILPSILKVQEVLEKNLWISLLLVVVITIPSITALIKPGFFPTQDYIYVARLYQMDKSLKDGQFPVRWVPDFRYGEPLYNFYAPLPYYIGAVVKNLGLNYLDTIKVIFGLGFIFSAIAMFFLGRELFGNLGGIVSATLYTYAPYHSVDVYVRGALSESWALIFFPLVFLFSYKLSENVNTKNITFLALSLAALFYTHNIMTVLFLPFFLAWTIFLIFQKGVVEKVKTFGLVKGLIFAVVLGFGLAASFLLPAFFEKSFVQSDRLISGYFDFRAHFVAVWQWIIPSWGYGASVWGYDDGMSFQVGPVHLLVLGLAAVTTFLLKTTKKTKMLLLFVVSAFLFSLFMQHNKSTFIWVNLSTLSYTQFPWRFLAVSIFFVSMAGGILLRNFKNQLSITLVLVLAALLLNYSYFRFESYYEDSIDSHYISAEALSKDDRLPKDYLPIWVEKIKEEKITTLQVLEGEAEVKDFKKRSSSARFIVNVKEESLIEAPITYFPGWKVYADGLEIPQEDTGELGVIRFKLSPGEYEVDLKFTDTPIRQVGNAISIFSLFLITGLLWFRKRLL